MFFFGPTFVGRVFLERKIATKHVELSVQGLPERAETVRLVPIPQHPVRRESKPRPLSSRSTAFARCPPAQQIGFNEPAKWKRLSTVANDAKNKWCKIQAMPKYIKLTTVLTCPTDGASWKRCLLETVSTMNVAGAKRRARSGEKTALHNFKKGLILHYILRKRVTLLYFAVHVFNYFGMVWYQSLLAMGRYGSLWVGMGWYGLV